MKKAVLISCFDWYEKRLLPIKTVLEKEYEITVFMSDYDHINKQYLKNREQGIIYQHVPSYKKNVSIRRIMSHVYFGYCVKRYIYAAKPDLIYVLIPPNMVVYNCLKYKLKNRDVKIIVDVIDMWPESFPFAKYNKMFVLNYWRMLRDKYISHCDYLITECDLYHSHFSFIDEEKISTLYLFKKTNEDFKLDIKSNNKRINSSHTIILGYVGSINHILDINSICEIIKQLSLAYTVEFRVIGDGECKENFISELNKQNIVVKYYGKIFDEKKKMEILSDCDYGINMMVNNVEVGLTIKSIDYFSYGLPIINNIKGDTAYLVSKYGIGVNYTDGLNILDEISVGNIEMKKRVISIFNEMFTEEAFKEKITDIMKKI